MAKIKIGNSTNTVVVGDSVSNSTISVSSKDSNILFSDIRIAIEKIENIDEKNTLKNIVDGMEKSVGQSDFTSYYKEFTQIAATHLTLLSPFIPALSALIS